MHPNASYLRSDAPAGVVVFLVALPLCLGIALASGAPLIAGLIAGIVGGMVVGPLSGSQLSVTGPAAGLAVIVAASIRELGSYPAFLAAVVLAGGLQVILGLARMGALANYVPNSVIKGMLAGIGVVIILKQIPHALGRDKNYEGDLAFFDPSGSNTLSEIAQAVLSYSIGPVLVATACLVLLTLWEKQAKRYRLLRQIPGPVAAVLLGLLMNASFARWASSMAVLDTDHLVSLPVATSMTELVSRLSWLEADAFSHANTWGAAGTLAVVCSIESLLSLEASDRLDPRKRISPPNRELLAQGIGNIVSGALGGLPVTSVVVRTSANVYAGAQTWLSTFTHGVLLLMAVVAVPGILNRIPLACLAAVLIMVGLKLTQPALYRKMYSLGWDQFVPFIVTVLGVVFTDLLTGVLTGLACGIFFVIRTNHRGVIAVVNDGQRLALRFTKDASFVNKNELRQKLSQVPDGTRVVIDGSRAAFIDHDIMEVVEDFQALAPHRGIQVELIRWGPKEVTGNFLQ